MQKHTYYLARYLARIGVYVDLYYVVPEKGRDEKQLALHFTEEEAAFIRCVRIDRPAGHRFPGHYIWESYRISCLIWESLRDQLDVDFIYAQGFAGWKTLMVKRKYTLPPIGVNFHGYEMWQRAASIRTKLEHWMLRPFVANNIRQADAALLLGQKLAVYFEAIASGAKRIMVSPNGVTADWIAPVQPHNTDPVRFVFLGRYERRKGIEELHEAIRQLDGHYDFRIDLIGPIPEALRINSPRVHYWGLLKAEEHIRTILQQSDVLVCPSYAEGMPTVILEAMASGLAVIATDVGAVGDLVTEENGWLIPAGNHVALERALLEAIAGPRDVLEEKRQASRDLVEHRYLWEKVAADTTLTIESMLHECFE